MPETSSTNVGLIAGQVPARRATAAREAVIGSHRPPGATDTRRNFTALWLVPAVAIGVFVLVLVAAHLFPHADQPEPVATAEAPKTTPNEQHDGELPADLAAIQSELTDRQARLEQGLADDLSGEALDLIDQTDAALAALPDALAPADLGAGDGQPAAAASDVRDLRDLRERLSELYRAD